MPIDSIASMYTMRLKRQEFHKIINVIQFVVGCFFFKKSFKRGRYSYENFYLWGNYIRMGTYILEILSSDDHGYFIRQVLVFDGYYLYSRIS